MERQKEANNNGILYLILLLGNILVCVGGVFFANSKFNSSLLMTLLCELFILVPVLFYLRSKGENIPKSLGFHKIKISTIFLTVLLTIAVTPIYTFANVLSQLFVSNTVVQNSDAMLEGSVIGTLLLTCVVAPLFEEITFRGFFFNRLKGISSVLKAALVSAVLFGVMHLNLNQFSYAVVLGFVFALANHASGSTWTSVIMHFLVNLGNTAMIILASIAAKQLGTDVGAAAEAARTTPGVLQSTAVIYGVLAVIFAFAVWFLLKAIAKNEGNLEKYMEAFSKKNAPETDAPVRVHSVLNAPMLLSIGVGVVAMVVFQFTIL